jgi:DNA-binding MarR family transcriptional regulator
MSGARIPETADRLRYAVARLARLLRQQDEGGLGATAISALASVRQRGPLTLGELATGEHVAPPTMTKVVEKLESSGYIERDVDPMDRRVSRVSITAAGSRHLEATKSRRTAWLAGRLVELDEQQRMAIIDALEALERLAGVESSPDSLVATSGRTVEQAGAGR